MTKFTKEQLQEIAETDHVQCGDASALARMALAGMEQEPVACIDRANLDYLESGAGADVWPASGADSDDVLLYAAPQLPQPAVPGMAAVGEMPFLGTQENAFVSGWNACRAAMLQGAEPVSQPYALRDGWVAVPVGPTPEMNKAGWAAMNEHDAINPTYMAMLAAAPDYREISNSSTKHFRENEETSTNCPHCGRKPLKNRKCSVAGCEGRHVAHGLCQKHYDIEHKNNLSRRKNIRAANKRYRARRSAAPQQEVKSALEAGMARYGNAMQKLADGGD